MKRSERRAYVCQHKDCVPPTRMFLRADEPVPKCHGRVMVRQANLSYTRPDVSAPIGKSQTTRRKG